jgi:succinate dehydrogenase / fumarate reductase membrane anchor subunit
MVNEKNNRKPIEGTGIWLLKIITGILVIVVLAIHFMVNHWLAPNGLLSYVEVVKYFQNPLVLVMEGLFLVFVVSHSLTGLRGIILDLNPNHSTMRIIDIVLVVLGVVSVVYGVWLLFAVAGQGAKV